MAQNDYRSVFTDVGPGGCFMAWGKTNTDLIEIPDCDCEECERIRNRHSPDDVVTGISTGPRSIKQGGVTVEFEERPANSYEQAVMETKSDAESKGTPIEFEVVTPPPRLVFQLIEQLEEDEETPQVIISLQHYGRLQDIAIAAKKVFDSHTNEMTGMGDVRPVVKNSQDMIELGRALYGAAETEPE